MLKILNPILNFIYPPRCYICDMVIEQKGLCLGCMCLLTKYEKTCIKCGINLDIDTDICLKCINKNKVFDQVNYVFRYNNAIFQIINKFKYLDDINIKNFILPFLHNELLSVLAKQKIDMIIPVPSDYFKLIKRRYNHAAFLAKDMAQKQNIVYNGSILRKKLFTKSQVLLGGKERINNLKNTFFVSQRDEKLLKNKNIVLVDDVITTGSTVHHCSKQLKNSGANSVYVIAFARVDGELKV